MLDTGIFFIHIKVSGEYVLKRTEGYHIWKSPGCYIIGVSAVIVNQKPRVPCLWVALYLKRTYKRMEKLYGSLNPGSGSFPAGPGI